MTNVINSVPVRNLPTTPTIFHLSMPLAATEYSYAIPAGTRELYINNSTSGIVQFAWTSLQSATVYITISRGAFYTLKDINLTDKVFYVQCDNPGQILQIETWA